MTKLSEETKIKVINALDALTNHALGCEACTEFLRHGDGDLCDHGNNAVAMELAYADTTPETKKEVAP